MSSLRANERVQDGMLPENENFAVFFEHWLAEQDRILHLLLAAAAPNNDADRSSPHNNVNNVEEDRRVQQLRSLVDRVLVHYEHYYRAKAASTRRDAAPMFNPRWRSSSEKMFMWVGGWRPSMAIQLLYSKLGLQLQDSLDDVLRGVPAGDLANLSPEQFARVDELHRRTVKKEREITEAAAQVQETIVGSDVVGLSHALTEMKRQGAEREAGAGQDEQVRRRMEAEMRPKKEGMAGVLERADALRLETLKEVVAILVPLQAVHFLVAAAEVHLRVHEWGWMVDVHAGPDRD